MSLTLLGAGRGVGGPDSWQPSDLASIEAWLQETLGNTYIDGFPPTTLCGVDDLVYEVGDIWGVGTYGKQTTEVNRLVQKSDGGQPLYGTSSFLLTDSGGVAKSIALTGEFTLYAAGDYQGSSGYVPFARTTGATYVGPFNDGSFYVVNDAGTAVSRAIPSSGKQCMKIRRNASNEIWVTWPGLAETNIGTLSGQITIDIVGSRPLGPSGAGSTSCRYAVQVIVAEDLENGSANDLHIRQLIASVDAAYVIG